MFIYVSNTYVQSSITCRFLVYFLALNLRLFPTESFGNSSTDLYWILLALRGDLHLLTDSAYQTQDINSNTPLGHSPFVSLGAILTPDLPGVDISADLLQDVHLPPGPPLQAAPPGYSKPAFLLPLLLTSLVRLLPTHLLGSLLTVDLKYGE